MNQPISLSLYIYIICDWCSYGPPDKRRISVKPLLYELLLWTLAVESPPHVTRRHVSGGGWKSSANMGQGDWKCWRENDQWFREDKQCHTRPILHFYPDYNATEFPRCATSLSQMDTPPKGEKKKCGVERKETLVRWAPRQNVSANFTV